MRTGSRPNATRTRTRYGFNSKGMGTALAEVFALDRGAFLEGGFAAVFAFDFDFEFGLDFVADFVFGAGFGFADEASCAIDESVASKKPAQTILTVHPTMPIFPATDFVFERSRVLVSACMVIIE